MDNGHHAILFDMSAFWDILQRFDGDDKEISGITDFFDRAEGDARTEEKIPRFQAILHFQGQIGTTDF